MRGVMHGDLVAAARALLPVPPAKRGGQIARWLAEAHAADRYFRRFGRVHRHWGDGSLRTRVLGAELPPEPALTQPDYLHCLRCVLAALARRRRG
jgi:hypothetical protein